MLDRLPEGMQTRLGEGGGLVSGGEGQRVRLGRAFARPDARLVILDEPFRGLDRDKRHVLLQRARRHWSGATLLCITHDVSETIDFPRVLVVDRGRIVEDAPPLQAKDREGSPYRAILLAEQRVRRERWGDPSWRKVTIDARELSEQG
jgi:ATP-binding cassette subfamily B protein